MPATPRKLLELQRWFYAALQRTPDGVSKRVRRSGDLTPNDRFQVYRGMYWTRLIEALGENYPRVAKALGEAAFTRVSRRYLENHPSRHPSLRYLGHRWPEHLRSHRVRGFPQLADLARLDRAVLDSFDAPDVTPLTVDDIKDTPSQSWSALRFQLAPCVHLLRLQHPILGEAPKAPRSRYDVRVYRLGHEVRHAPMDARQARALRALQRGHSFGEICVIMRDAQSAANSLATWLQDGLLLRA